jgi:hypothetical protein
VMSTPQRIVTSSTSNMPVIAPVASPYRGELMSTVPSVSLPVHHFIKSVCLHACLYARAVLPLSLVVF